VDIAGLATGLECEGWTVIAVNMSPIPSHPLTPLYHTVEGWGGA
jgi:hypothetical protein